MTLQLIALHWYQLKITVAQVNRNVIWVPQQLKIDYINKQYGNAMTNGNAMTIISILENNMDKLRMHKIL